jgi:hypothetical protein
MQIGCFVYQYAKLIGFGYNFFMWIRISGSAGIADGFSKFLETGCRTIFNDLVNTGCFVYQYAKLRMLEFYYDFMDVFVDRSDFQYCSMDTDSAYMALSATSLEEVIKPEMQQLSSFPKQ